MTEENRKGMKDVSTSNVSHVSRKPLQCIDVTTPVAGHVAKVTLPKSRFETIAMPMVCSLTEHGFPSVFSMVGKIMLCSKERLYDPIYGSVNNLF